MSQATATRHFSDEQHHFFVCAGIAALVHGGLTMAATILHHSEMPLGRASDLIALVAIIPALLVLKGMYEFSSTVGSPGLFHSYLWMLLMTWLGLILGAVPMSIIGEGPQLILGFLCMLVRFALSIWFCRMLFLRGANYPLVRVLAWVELIRLHLELLRLIFWIGFGLASLSVPPSSVEEQLNEQVLLDNLDRFRALAGRAVGAVAMFCMFLSLHDSSAQRTNS